MTQDPLARIAPPRTSRGAARDFHPGAAPVFKWAGGKRWMIPLVGEGIRARLALTGGRYLEPFLGGGALALWLGAPRAHLGDVERPLVDAYAAIVADPDAVAHELASLVRQGVDEPTFLRIRAAQPRLPARRAARLLYLNKTAFNGLYRTNRAGRFNVPYGAYRSPAFPSVAALRAVAASLAGATLVAGDFAGIVAAAGPGDVVFADPPYDGPGFRSYASEPFTPADQARLALELRRAARRGAVVIATNVDTPAVRAWYDWAHVVTTAERRAINARGSGRGAVPCLVITNVPSLLSPQPLITEATRCR